MAFSYAEQRAFMVCLFDRGVLHLHVVLGREQSRPITFPIKERLLPNDRGYAVLAEICVGPAEMLAAKKTAMCREWRRMRCFENEMTARIDHG